jgi:hypothetical protein
VDDAISRFVDLHAILNKLLSDNFSTFCSKEKYLQFWASLIDQGLLIPSVSNAMDVF